jgi:hypothetical protein
LIGRGFTAAEDRPNGAPVVLLERFDCGAAVLALIRRSSDGRSRWTATEYEVIGA